MNKEKVDEQGKKSIHFFMLVTNRDIYLADYCIKSYQKLEPVLANYEWKLIVYLNGVKDSFKEEYAKEWGKLNYVEVIDNSEFVDLKAIVPGTYVYSDEGWAERVEGQYETCGVTWTRGFRNFQSDYWATVDADFEILSADFVVDALEKLESDENTWVVASDYGNNRYYYNSYNNEYILAMQRYATWFCIYKREAQQCKTSHFYYAEVIKGIKFSYDSAAKLQYDLREQFNCKMQTVDSKYQRSFIHYGAFSKNSMLDTKEKVALYRKITLLAHRGLSENNSILDKITRRIFRNVYKKYYAKSQKDRENLNYRTKLDD